MFSFKTEHFLNGYTKDINAKMYEIYKKQHGFRNGNVIRFSLKRLIFVFIIKFFVFSIFYKFIVFICINLRLLFFVTAWIRINYF